MLRFPISSVVVVVAIVAVSPCIAAAQQPDLSLNPFVSFLPTGSAGPMAGLALTLADGPLALRAGAHLSIQDRNLQGAATTAETIRPWAADADAIAFLQSLSYRERVALTPYVFAGLGVTALDSASYRILRQGWSYGGGAMVPLGSALGLFGEWRWRLNKFVMPDAHDAPRAMTEIRVGATFHIGHGGETGRAVPVVLSGESLGSDDDNAPSASAMRLLSMADQFVGTPYRRGGNSPSGFDASGFVRFVFARLGVNLPRRSSDQARVGDRVRTDWHVIAPGDLLLFQDGNGINHVAIYAGRNRIIHSSETGGGVRYDDLSTDRGQWFIDHLVAARRVQPDLRGLLVDLARGYASEETGNSDGPDHAPRVSMRYRP